MQYNTTHAHSTLTADNNQLMVPLKHYTGHRNTIFSSNLIFLIVSWICLVKESESDSVSDSFVAVDVLIRHLSAVDVCESRTNITPHIACITMLLVLHTNTTSLHPGQTLS